MPLDKKSIEKMTKELRTLPTKECLLKNIKRVDVFTAVDMFKLLSSKKYFADEIKEFVAYLLEEGIILKISVVDQSTLTEGCLVDISLKKDLEIHDKFMWSSQDHAWIYRTLVLLIVCIVGLISLTIYAPNWYRYVLYYLKYPLFGFLLLMLISGVIRWIVYLITLLACNEQLWIWPNLFADVGFFGSFVPLYEWTKPESESKHE